MSHFQHLYVGPYVNVIAPITSISYDEPDFIENESRLVCVCNIDLRADGQPIEYNFVVSHLTQSPVPFSLHADSILGFVNVPISVDIEECKRQFHDLYFDDIRRICDHYQVAATIKYGALYWFK